MSAVESNTLGGARSPWANASVTIEFDWLARLVTSFYNKIALIKTNKNTVQAQLYND